MKIADYLKELERFAPLSLSKAFVAKGAHDNSGILVKSSDEVNGAVFSLDLSKKAIETAIDSKSDVIVTHHPAIYYPISEIGASVGTEDLLNAVKNGLSVISMHLNLDIARGGIDDCLAAALGGFEPIVLDEITPKYGYGREFCIKETPIDEYVKEVTERLNAKQFSVYKVNGTVKKVASFCGGGSSDAVNYGGDADLIVTSDAPHHAIKALVEKGKSVLLLTHYASEIYGFKKFYENVKDVLPSKFVIEEKYL